MAQTIEILASGRIIPIGPLQPGRELDALIAEKVMGFILSTVHDGTDQRYCFHGLNHDAVKVEPYSTSIAAAWEVVEKFDYLYLFHGTVFKWECKLVSSDHENYYARNCDTAPLAICKASLFAAPKAVELT